ncbi:globoside alpha-1,3-N-acetylgalactosaminyltransferase 1-like isoform X2 [Electrophorus electricus]|uniref:globoside alpha-1,3-N-acetylgalactosaminyltransferase 1-like isoform X2 n=1 Tax=Electrophorus electricus TaxID=8005 RepID=UPI0015D01E61|nr:globoside alpha-1,3-N-acetylgalactosaminyltransferase 1-like isoform X2 [Electrophorus electricus]
MIITMRSTQSCHLFLLSLLGVLLVGCIYLGYTSSWISVNVELEELTLYSSVKILYKQPSVLNGRKDVITVTPWLAPVVWEETFDKTLIDAIYKMQNITVATTVFALGKYVQFLKDFLESAERHYLQGYRVHYYIFTDQPEAIPMVTLGANRNLTTLKIPGSSRWQEITLRRMEKLEKLIDTQMINEVDYIFSLDVDTKFYGHWGAETLGDIVAVIHPGYYSTPRDEFPYERRPESQAYIPQGMGDYYYGGAVIGGLVEEVHKLAKTCRMQLDVDKANSIEAAWQEESHLNKYFLYNKPSKILSPEYLWQDFKSKTDDIKIIRFSQVIKNYAEVRPNP